MDPGHSRLTPAVASLLLLATAAPAAAQQLDLPPRPTDAPGASELVPGLIGLGLEEREERLIREIERGNVPEWTRSLVPITVRRSVGGRTRSVTFRVTPDYLAVGSSDDALRIPLTPQAAQRIGELTGTALPTTAIVDAVWAHAGVRLAPEPMTPDERMTTVPVFVEHDGYVSAQRATHRAPPDALVAGHKKDVVLSAALDTLRSRVAIYGWHRLGGEPIQPLYTGHSDRWVDYSHGIRLVHRVVQVDGVVHDLLELLRDPVLSAALSDEGRIAMPRYEAREGG